MSTIKPTIYCDRPLNDSEIHGGVKQTGFTLIEVILAVIILGALATVGTTMIYSGFVTSNYVNAENSAVASGRYALERISREMRESDPYRFDTAATGVVLTANQIGYTRKNGTESTTIKYNPSSKRLTMAESLSSPDYTLAENVVLFDCKYRYPLILSDPRGPSRTPDPKCSEITTTSPLPSALSKIELLIEIQDSPDGPRTPMNKIVILRNNL